jgi:hypothetical protein
MARLGELLTASRLIEPDKVEQALRAQVVWGGRLGTNLIELGVIEIDGLSRALGRQHGIPAALGRHFDKSDPDLQRVFPAELARKYSVVPLFHVGADRKIALVALDPLRADALVAVADALKCSSTQLVVSIAAEMRVRYHLERVYGIARTTRYLRTKGKSATPFPQFEIEFPIEIEEEDSVPSSGTPIAALTDKPTGRAAVPPPPANVEDLAALIDAASESTPFSSAKTTGTERRTYVKTLADAVEAALPGPTVTSSFPAAEPSDDAPLATIGRIAIKRVQLAATPTTTTTQPTPPPPASGSAPAPAIEAKEASSFLDATKKIRRGPNRDRVAELVIEALQKFVPACEAAILLVVRGDVAIGWKHFCRTGNSNGEIAVPLDEPGLVPSAIRSNVTSRGRASELNAIDQLLLRALGCDAGDLAVIPIAIAGQVMCALAFATTTDGGLVPFEAIASSAGTAFSRLIRDASR